MPWFIRMSVVAVGLCGAGGILYNRHWEHRYSPERNRELVRLAAAALSGEVVDTVLFRDEESMKLLRRFVKDVCLHPDVVEALKVYVKAEFTTNEETVAALRKFIVEDIICDPWVSDELISMAKETGKEIIKDPAVYPGPSLNLLGTAAKEGLRTNAFKNALRRCLRSSFWLAYFDPQLDYIHNGNAREINAKINGW